MQWEREMVEAEKPGRRAAVYELPFPDCILREVFWRRNKKFFLD